MPDSAVTTAQASVVSARTSSWEAYLKLCQAEKATEQAAAALEKAHFFNKKRLRRLAEIAQADRARAEADHAECRTVVARVEAKLARANDRALKNSKVRDLETHDRRKRLNEQLERLDAAIAIIEKTPEAALMGSIALDHMAMHSIKQSHEVVATERDKDDLDIESKASGYRLG